MPMTYKRPENSPAPAAAAGRVWSPQQQGVREWFAAGRGNRVVRARAGTGKTTTILYGIDAAPEASILLAAFNKRIANELVAKLRNPRATAKTLHSVGFGLIRRAWQSVRLDDDRKLRLARKAWASYKSQDESAAPDSVCWTVARLAGLGKNVMPLAAGLRPAEAIGQLEELALEFDHVPEDERYTARDVAAMAHDAMTRALERDGTIDFDDMIYLPVAQGWLTPAYDLVVIDEAQDMNLTQLLLAKGVVRKAGRVCVVGDDRQAIYGFRGAAEGAIDQLKFELNADEAPLTVSFRCPRLVVEEAKKLVPDFEAAPGAPDGEVLHWTEAQMREAAAPGDFILSRLNAPIARHCLALLREGRRARIEGRDVAKNLISLVRRSRARDLADCLAWVTGWRDREVDNLRGNASPSAQRRIDYVYDQADTIAAMADGLGSVPELIDRIEALFAPGGGDSVILSTIHRAKGLEADRVFILKETLYIYGRRPDDIEEKNLAYVAITRAMKTLVYVTAPKASAPAPGAAAVAPIHPKKGA